MGLESAGELPNPLKHLLVARVGVYGSREGRSMAGKTLRQEEVPAQRHLQMRVGQLLWTQ
jgi:hypothetical protein